MEENKVDYCRRAWFKTARGGAMDIKEKGLCSNCVSDKDCGFSRIFPVLHCEEFSYREPELTKPNKQKPEKSKKSNH